MKKHKITGLILFVLVLVLSLPLCGCDALYETPVEDFEYQANDEGITIVKYNGTDDRVVIPKVIDEKNVTIIGEMSFAGSNITSVVMPDTVKHINQRAFSACENLSEVQMSSSLTTIGISAFNRCKSLTTVDLSMPTLIYIGTCAFVYCENLKSVIFGDNIETIKDAAFEGCAALEEVTLPVNLKTLEYDAFASCTALKRVTIGKNLNLANGHSITVFYDTPALEEIIFEDGREEISGYGFFNITSDVKIRIPKSVKQFSPAPFIVPPNYTDGTLYTISVYFAGDCPEVTGTNSFFGDATFYYDPSMQGWDTFVGDETFDVKPID